MRILTEPLSELPGRAATVRERVLAWKTRSHTLPSRPGTRLSTEWFLWPKQPLRNSRGSLGRLRFLAESPLVDSLRLAFKKEPRPSGSVPGAFGPPHENESDPGSAGVPPAPDAGKMPALPGRDFRQRSRAGIPLVCLFCILHSAFCISQDWPQFRGNSTLSGVTTAALPATLKVLWTYDAGESIESSAAIVGGVVYVGAQTKDDTGVLLALDLETGKEKWKYPTPRGIQESSPAVANGVVYVGDLGGTFHAVDARTGKALWTYKTGTEIKSSPVVVEDKVLIGSYDEHLYCLNAKTGAVIWKFKIDGPVHATPSIANGMAYLAGCDEIFHAVRLSDGKEAFRVSSGAYTGASAAVSGTTAFYGTFNNDVLAVNLTAHRIVWRYEHPVRKFPYYASAAVVDGKVIAAGRDKMVHALDARTGKAVWTFATKARVESSPAVTGGRIYVGSNDGNLYVLDLAKGAKLFEFNAGGPLSASPAISGGRLVIGNQDGKLFCLGG